MAKVEQIERDIVRVIALSSDGGNLLLLPGENGYLLPSVTVPRWERPTESLAAEMAREWGYEVICIFTPGASLGKEEPYRYQVAECWRRVASDVRRSVWTTVSSLVRDSFCDEEDFFAVQRALSRCTVRQDDSPTGPFANLGWFKQLQTWVTEAIEPLGIELTGSFRQLNASSSFSLIRFGTNRQAVWFKAVGEPNRHERAVILTLARSFPNYVAPVLATHSRWNGWLSPEMSGQNLGDTRSVELWKFAAEALACLQVESIPDQDKILESGARNLSLPVLRSSVLPFMEAMSALMEQQNKFPPAALSPADLRWLVEQIHEAFDVIHKLQIPGTLGHCDLNPSNIIVRPDGCTFLDWAEAYVGHPFFSFEYLLEHFRRRFGACTSAEAALADSYVRPWHRLLSRSSIALTLMHAPLLAVFAYAAGGNLWRSSYPFRTAATSGYLRALTRRMGVEAEKLVDWRKQCLS